MSNTTSTLRGACSAPSFDNSRQWADAAIDNELNILEKMPEGTNINKPGNDIFVSLLKIASVVRGGHVPEHEALNSVKKSLCAFTWIPQKEIDYQWGRAMQRAKPRYPRQQNRLPAAQPKTAVQPSYQITEYDINTGKTAVLRHVSTKTAVKARELVLQIKSYVEDGEIRQGSNLAISTVHLWREKVDLILTFPRWTQALSDCVIIACSMLKGSMSEDFHNGRFAVIVPLTLDDAIHPASNTGVQESSYKSQVRVEITGNYDSK